MSVIEGRQGFELWATVVSSGQSHCVYRRAHTKTSSYFPFVEFGCTSATSSYVLLSATVGGHPEVAGSSGQEIFTVRVPDGKVKSMSGYPSLVAGEYAVGSEGKNVLLYSAATGRLVKQYRN